MAGVSLTLEVHRDQGDAHELRVGTHIGWHRDSCFLLGGLESKGFQALWRVTDTLDWDIFYYKVYILKVGFSMIWSKVESEFLGLPSLNFTLNWLYSIMSLLIR